MDIARQLLAVCVVLALLLGLLWWTRRGVGFRVSGWGRAKSSGRSMESVERLALTAQHTLHLVRLNGEHLLLIGVHPSGFTLLEKFSVEPKAQTAWKESL